MTWPAAEVDVHVELVRELVRRQHPDLSGNVREVSSGFDNSIWQLGSSLVVRLPRRQVAVTLIEHEQRWLPSLAPRLPLQVPTPIRKGRPSDLFSWPWSISNWIEGTPGNEIDPAVRAQSAADLGEFFRALHRDAPLDAPHNEFRGVPLRDHGENFQLLLTEVGSAVDRANVAHLWDVAINATPWVSTPQWIHGDPHPANLIYSDDRLVGVIDFGDLCAGDPATDLAAGLMTMPLTALDSFFDAYGGVDDDLLQRTLGWAVHFGLMFVLLGETDEPTYGPLGHQALTNAVDFARSHR